jgi:hypothetical protein
MPPVVGFALQEKEDFSSLFGINQGRGMNFIIFFILLFSFLTVNTEDALTQKRENSDVPYRTCLHLYVVDIKSFGSCHV